MACDFSHVVIGGGAVGLAIAARLARSTVASNVLLIERNRSVGTETSSRNSEVIHAGLYYAEDSLKTSLCLRGKHMLYDLLERHNIPYARTGKWIVAQDGEQAEYLHTLKRKADALDVPVRFRSRQQAETLEPHVRVRECALESTSTGIMDSHALMTYLLGQFEAHGGDVSLNTSIASIEKMSSSGAGGYRLSTTTTHHGGAAGGSGTGGERYDITTECVINSAGLNAVPVANMVLPKDKHFKAYYAKGQYYSYTGQPRPSRLIYPCPEKDLAGLGTHLTLDLNHQVRFGPDIEWIDDPTDYSTSAARLDQVYRAVSQFFPSLDRTKLEVDYCGIRPKLAPAGAAATDFYIAEESGNGNPGFVNLLGIESPGLTSCLSIAEYVENLIK